MALSIYQGSFTGSASTGNQAITDPGFTPQWVIFYYNSRATTGNSHFFAGIGCATGATEEWSANSMTRDNRGTSVTDHIFVSDACYVRLATNSNVAGRADFVSFDANGFTINWTNADAVQINYICGAGYTDAVAGTTDLTTSTGNQTDNSLGVDPDAMMFGGSILNTTESSTVDGHLWFGTTDGTNEWVVLGWDEDGVITTNGDRLIRNDACICNFDGAGSEDVRASFVSFNTGGYTVNKSNAPASTMRIGYLALEGGDTVVGTDTAHTVSETDKTTTNNAPDGLILCSQGSGTLNSSGRDFRWMFGATDGTRQNAINDTSDADLGTSNSFSHEETSTYLSFDIGGTKSGEADISSFDSDGFTLDWTPDPDSSAKQFGYISLGDVAGVGPKGPLGLPLHGPLAGPLG